MGGSGCERFGRSLLGPRSMVIAGSLPGGAIDGSACVASSRTVSRDHSSQSCRVIAVVLLDGPIGRLTKNRRSIDLCRSVGARATIFLSVSSEGPFNILPTRLWSLGDPHGWLVSGGDSTNSRVGVRFWAMFLRSSVRWFMDEGVLDERIFSITGMAHW